MEQPQAGIAQPLTAQQGSIVSRAAWVIGFSLLTGVGAQLQIPHVPVPYTLQTLFVLLSGAVLGKRNGAFSQLLYLAAGAAGVPLFAGFGFGIARLLGPTGGYLLGFPFAAFAVGYLIGDGTRLTRVILAMAIGLLIIFSLGTLQLNFLYEHDLSQAFAHGFMIFSWWDVVKLCAAVAMYRLLVGSRIRVPQ